MNKNNLPTFTFSRFFFIVWSLFGIWAGYVNNNIAMNAFAVVTLVFSFLIFVFMIWITYSLSKLSASDFYNKQDRLQSSLKAIDRYGSPGYYIDCFINIILAIGLIFVGYTITPTVSMILLMLSAACCAHLKILINKWIEELKPKNPFEYKL